MRLIPKPAFAHKTRSIRRALCVIASVSAIAPGVVSPAVMAASTAQSSPFVGAWNMTGTGADSSSVYWLEIKEADGKLTGSFLNRVGNPVPLGSVKVDNGELIFQAG